jgi:multidrug efflux pump subunit AcrA (membrane-fusion protein)
VFLFLSGLVSPAASKPEIVLAPAVSVPVRLIRPVDSYAVDRVFPGMVTARQQADLGFERPGKILQLLVREGQQVDAGQPLARLNSAVLLARRDVLDARRAKAKAVLRELETGPRPEEILLAQARLEEELAEHLERQQHHNRLAALAENNLIAAADLEESSNRRDAAEARVKAAEATLAQLESGTRRERVEAQRAAVAEAEASFFELEAELDHCELQAPFAATVSAVHLDSGSVVRAGLPVLRIVETDFVEIRVGVPIAVAASIEVGSTQELDVRGHCCSAEVVAILPELDPSTRTKTILLELRTDVTASPGEIVQWKMVQTIRESGAWLPTTALATAGGGSTVCHVLAAESGESHSVSRTVEVLHTEAGQCFVRGPFDASEFVVQAGVDRIVAGQRLQPVVLD